VIDELGRHLVDGGLVAVIPTVVTRAMGADIVIAVDVNSAGSTFIGPTSSIIGVLFQSMMVVQKTASAYQRDMADLVIDPKVGHVRWDEMGRAEELIEAGYEAGLKSIPEIREVITSAGSKEAQREEMLA
jgi:NTE family protein